MKRGFTLVELSAILVIMGVLIGGIMIIQSMNSSARVQTLVSSVQSYDAAVTGFKTKYNSLPGDSKLFAGNGNAYIQDANHGYNNFSGEIAKFWVDLQKSGFLKYEYNFSSELESDLFNITSSHPNSPVLSLDNKAGVIVSARDYSLLNAYGFGNFEERNFSPSNGVDGIGYLSAPGNAPLEPETTLAIDTKIDDALPTSGNVRGGLFGSYSENCINTGSLPNIYNIGNSKSDCDLTVKLLATSASK